MWHRHSRQRSVHRRCERAPLAHHSLPYIMPSSCVFLVVSFVWRSTVTSRETLSNETNWFASRCGPSGPGNCLLLWDWAPFVRRTSDLLLCHFRWTWRERFLKKEPHSRIWTCDGSNSTLPERKSPMVSIGYISAKSATIFRMRLPIWLRTVSEMLPTYHSWLSCWATQHEHARHTDQHGKIQLGLSKKTS